LVEKEALLERHGGRLILVQLDSERAVSEPRQTTGFGGMERAAAARTHHLPT